MNLHKDKNRRRPLRGMSNSKLDVLLRQINRHNVKPTKKQIVAWMNEYEITDDPVEAWRVWSNDIKPML